MNVVYLKDKFYARRKAKKSEQLLPYDLGAELIAALEQELSELDKLGLEEKQRSRIVESL